MNFTYSCISKFLQNQIRFMSNRSKTHYDALGIPSNSTQGEIKSAYYKLSMMYHPDKNQGNEEYSKKFRDVTAAYEVLGNVKTRKLYDKGLYFGSTTAAADDPINKFYKSRETRSKPPPPSGRTPIYDFDEWSRNHYGATFQKQQENKRKGQMHRRKLEDDANDVKMEKLFFIFGVLLLASMYIFHEDNSSYDNVNFIGPVRTKKDEKDLR